MSEEGVRLIPNLKEREHTVPPFSVGKWTPLEKSKLDHISKGLEISSKSFVSSSIPDIWARPIVFEIALFDAYHPMHTRVMGEWRGLLAILALKERYRLSINVEVINLHNSSKKTSSSSIFLKALESLCPYRTISPDTNWSSIHLIILKDLETDLKHPLGIFSPTTLVMPACDMSEHPLDFVPWFNGSYLLDPVEFLNEKERSSLARWLLNIRGEKDSDFGFIGHINSVANTTASNDESGFIKERLLNCIGTNNSGFIGDLDCQPQREINLSSEDYGITYGFYKLFNRSVIISTGDQRNSPIRLKPQGRTTDKSVLVVDDNIPKQWDMSEDALMALEGFSFNELTNNSDKFLNEGIECWKTEDFFCERLIEIDAKNAFPGAIILRNKMDEDSFISPIKSKVLDLLSPQYVSNNLSIKKTASDTITVELRLELGEANSGIAREFVLRKTYQKKELIKIKFAPLIAVWPFINAGIEENMWKAYYTYFSTGDQPYEKDDTEKSPNTFYSKPYPGDDFLDSYNIKRSIVENDIMKETTISKKFPEAMECFVKLKEGTQLADLKECGMIFLQQPKFIYISQTWDVSIDFGTTSTCMFLKSGNDTMPLTFKHKPLIITAVSEGAKGDLGKEFLPEGSDSDDEKEFFLTFLKRRDTKLLDREYSHILRSIILFYTIKTSFSFDDCCINLKWGESSNDKINVKLFLRQLVLMIAAEAASSGVSTISWHFSYPSSFSQKRISDFKENWETLAKFVKDNSGIERGNSDDTNYFSKTESVAVGIYFKKKTTGSLVSGAVCVDIGGGTTDISIWKGSNTDNMLFQTSLKYAGRDIFLDSLLSHIDILTCLDNTITIEETNNIIKLSSKDFKYATLDALIFNIANSKDKNKDENNDWLDNYKNFSGEENFLKFKRDLIIKMSGLMFFVGILIKYLKNSCKAFAGDNFEMPDVFFGGNGSRVFTWISELKDSEDIDKSVYTDFFKSIILDAIAFDDTEFKKEEQVFTFSISAKPKSEVAHGLVLEPSFKGNNVDEVVISGEPFASSGEEYKWDGIITEDILLKGISINNLPLLLAYIKSFNDSLKKYELDTLPIEEFSKENLRLIYNKVPQILNDKCGEAINHNAVIEPIFLIGFKELLNYV